jgi:hypothetical protein
MRSNFLERATLSGLKFFKHPAAEQLLCMTTSVGESRNCV